MRPLGRPAWLRDLAGAWIFYTVLPAWPRLQPRFERIARFAPWIGLLQGLLQGLLWCLAEPWLPARGPRGPGAGPWPLAEGGIHADGVMDTADGLAAGERALEAMDDSRVGASGVLALVQVLLLRAAALLTLAELNLGAAGGSALVWAAVWGRIAPLLAMHGFPYLRPARQAALSSARTGSASAAELRPALLLLVLLTLVAASMGLARAGRAGPAAGAGWCRWGWAPPGRPQRRQLRRLRGMGGEPDPGAAWPWPPSLAGAG